MRKLVTFFTGLALLALMLGLVYLTGAIYTAGHRVSMDTYFFQPNNQSERRIGVPASPDDLSAEQMRDRLIQKYVTEYFYVIPDVNATTLRVKGQTSLRILSAPAVLNAWKQTIGPQLLEMADAKVLRTVYVDTSSISMLKGSDNYWSVPYTLHTWTRPNDLSAAPIVTNGIIHLHILYEPGIRKEIDDISVGEFLERGGDPAAVFKFIVLDATIES